MTDLREDERLTLASCLLVGVTSLAFAAIESRTIGSLVMGLGLVHAALALAGGLLVWSRRRASSLFVCQLVFAALTLYYLPEHWVTELHAADRGLLRDPLASHQFLLIGIALLSPGSPWLGAGLIAAATCSSFPMWWTLTALHPHLARATGEPWTMLLYSAIAAAFLAMRALRSDAMRRLAHAEAERDALARVARLFLAVRDRTNTPLQTLTFGAALLRRRGRDADPVLASMERAVDRLKELTTLLAEAETWHGAPIDTSADLKREVEEASGAVRSAFEREGKPRLDDSAAKE